MSWRLSRRTVLGLTILGATAILAAADQWWWLGGMLVGFATGWLIELYAARREAFWLEGGSNAD